MPSCYHLATKDGARLAKYINAKSLGRSASSQWRRDQTPPCAPRSPCEATLFSEARIARTLDHSDARGPVVGRVAGGTVEGAELTWSPSKRTAVFTLPRFAGPEVAPPPGLLALTVMFPLTW